MQSFGNQLQESSFPQELEFDEEEAKRYEAIQKQKANLKKYVSQIIFKKKYKEKRKIVKFGKST